MSEMPAQIGGFRMVAKTGNARVYQRWDQTLQKRVTVTFEGSGEKKLMHVKIEQPKWVTDTVLDDNVALQNSFAGYGKGDGLYQVSRVPLAVFPQLLDKCGFKPGQGYDEKKMKQILNDRDYSKLKVVPGRI